MSMKTNVSVKSPVHTRAGAGRTTARRAMIGTGAPLWGVAILLVALLMGCSDAADLIFNSAKETASVTMTGTLNGNDLQVEVKYQGPELTDDMTIDVSLSGRKNGLMGPATGNRVTLYAGTTSATLNFGGLKPDIYTLSATVDGVSVTVSTPTIEVADSILTVTTTNPDIVKSEDAEITLTLNKAPIRDVEVMIGVTPSTGPTSVAPKSVTFTTGSGDENLKRTVIFSTGTTGTTGTAGSGADITAAGNYRLMFSITNVADQDLIVLPDDAGFTVIDSSKPTIQVTPTVEDDDLSVAVAVSNGRLGDTERITIALTGGSTSRSPESAQLFNGSIPTTAAQTVEFKDLSPGSYTITATATPNNINITYYEGRQTVTILPQVTITHSLDGDDLTVTATVSAGPIGAEPVDIALAVDPDGTSSSSGSITLAADTAQDGTATHIFMDLPSGGHTLRATATADAVRIVNDTPGFSVGAKLPTVLLELSSTAPGTATVTARIESGTIESAVIIEAIIDGPEGEIKKQLLARLSGGSGSYVVTTFNDLDAGLWGLSDSSNATPGGIVLLDIPPESASVEVAAPVLPETTITLTVVDSDLSVAVAVTDGSELANDVTLTLKLTGGRTQFVTLDANTINPRASITFFNLSDGRYTLTATGLGLDITISDAEFVVGDDDGVLRDVDVDDDNDGLIEINFLEDLDYVRHNLTGTSYKPGASASASTIGAPTSPTTNCDMAVGGVYLCGYELARSLDFDEAASYRSGSVNTAWTNGAGPNTGWTPIGGSFNAIFEGNGHTIGDLRIARQDTRFIGLFGLIGGSGEVRDLALSNAQVDYTGSRGSPRIGPLVGRSEGTIVAVSATGGIVGGGSTGAFAGGLVGLNEGGTITASYASGAVSSRSFGTSIGGLVGQNGYTTLAGTITASYATGDVNVHGVGSTQGGYVGGLVGGNNATITASYATGDVNGSDDDDRLGGLVGINNATITASHASGTVDGGDGDIDRVGGLVGDNSGTITASHASGTADGGDGDGDWVGGLVGLNFYFGSSPGDNTITASYATGTVDGGDGDIDRVGGLVGFNQAGTFTASYGFGTKAGGEVTTGTVDRSDDASPATGTGAVTSAGLTAANSSTSDPAGTNDWSTRVWDFGTASQKPALKWITGFNSGGTTDVLKYPCDGTLLPTLPTQQVCGGIIPGQTR